MQESKEYVMKTVLLTGGTGLIGYDMSRLLREKGYRVILLSRSMTGKRTLPVYCWDPSRDRVDEEALVKADYIVHLAGENIGSRRWTSRRKEEIRNSRIQTTRLLFGKIRKLGARPEAFISASAIGYYGARTTDTVMTENDPPAEDFLGQLCREWEEAASAFPSLGIRTVMIRTGLALSARGGILKKLAFPARLGLGASLGSGKQFLPWIHIHDLSRIYLHAMESPEMSGAYNAVAPEVVSQREFLRALARRLKRPLWLPGIPAPLVRLALGEMSAMLLEGSMVSSEKLLATGFRFEYPELDEAVDDLFS